jgi:hypothetical protein
MSEQDQETAFLREIVRHDHTAEGDAVGEEIDRLEVQIRILRRAVFWMMGLTALAGLGLGYAAILSLDFPDNMWRFSRQFSVRVPSALALASVVCLLCFVGLGAVYRRQLNVQREKARRLGERLLVSQTGTGSGAGTMPTTPHAIESALSCINPDPARPTDGHRDHNLATKQPRR